MENFLFFGVRKDANLSRFVNIDLFEDFIAQSEKPGLFLYLEPHLALAHDIAERAFDGPSLRNWIIQAEHYLPAMRRMRRSLVILPMGSGDKPAVKTVFRSRFAGEDAPAGLTETPDIADDLQAVSLAALVIRSDEQAHEYLAELEASSSAALPARKSLLQQVFELSTGRSDQYGGGQSSISFDIEAAGNKVLSDQIEQLQETLADIQRKRQAEHDAARLHAAKITAERDAAKADVAKITAELEAARKALTALRASTSWRLTAPVRGVKDIFSGR